MRNTTNNERNTNNTKKILASFLLFAIGMGSVYVALKYADTALQSFSIGVIGSLIASFVFYYMSEVIINENATQKTYDNVNSLAASVQGVQSELSMLNKYSRDGLERIELIDAGDTSDDLWLDLLQKSEKGLDIIAHTLSPWFREKYAEEFRKQIKRICNSGGLVRILILDPDRLEGINTDSPAKYQEKIRSSLKEMAKIATTISPEMQKQLTVKLNSEFDISYSYIKNDTSTYVSPYLCSNDGRSSFIAVFKNDSVLADGFSKDFHDIFNNSHMKDFDRSVFPVLEQEKTRVIKNARYQSRTWNLEDTTRYVFNVGDKPVEAGYYRHYKDDTFVENVVELSTSYGCPYKCKYCASSGIPEVKPLVVDSLLGIFNEICCLNEIKSNESFVLAMTGTGDYSKTCHWTDEFLKIVCKNYPECRVILSSCTWNSDLINRVKDLIHNGVKIEYLQWTYVSSDHPEQIIPNIPHNNSIDRMGEIISEAICDDCLKGKFRINYLMIKDKNDHKAAFEQFMKVIEPAKQDLLIRISSLNETKCSSKNKLYAPSSSSLDSLEAFCRENNVKAAYVFKSEVNDNMNCGQLITES